MSGQYWTTEPNGYLEPKIEEKGFGSLPAKTVLEVFQNTVEKHGNRNALSTKLSQYGEKLEEWQSWTYQQYWDDCYAFGRSLLALGAGSFATTNIIGFNSPEWMIANLGSILAGCIPAGIYATNARDSCHYVTEHSKAIIVVLENNKQLEKYTKTAGILPNLKALVVWGEDPDPGLVHDCDVKVYKWKDFLKLGESISTSEMDTRCANVKPGNCASLIYTSGTTGKSKAVMISHDNITWMTKNLVTNYVDLNHTERSISYLPLSHIAAQISSYSMLVLGGCVYFAAPDALKGSLAHTMREVRPTFFFGVPRVWEKIQEKMVEKGRQVTGVQKILADWAKSIGKERSRLAQSGNEGGLPWGYGCANSLILSKVKEALGLDQAKACFSAAAPISTETLWYFASLDIPVFEVFGQSESTGPHTACAPGRWKIGSVGRPIKGSESKLIPETGELLYRGRHIFMGYMYMPDKTAETIDDDGFLHSGDIATFDDDEDPELKGLSGFMHITGRIKDLIVTAGGENVPPTLIQNEMKSAMEAVSNCLVIGDKRKFLTMLVSLKVHVDSNTGLPSDNLAEDALSVGKEIGSSVTTYSEAMKDEKWVKYIDNGMKEANGKTTSNAQIVKKWKWIPTDFSEKGGELTPTLKVKRNVVTEKYAEIIDSMYK